MALGTTWETRALSPERHLVFGSFRPQGSSALVNADTAPGPKVGSRGFSVARTSEGLYTVTFANAWLDMEACFTGVRGADASRYSAQGGDYSAANKTLQIRTYGPRAGSGYIPLNIFDMRLLSSDAFLTTIEGGTPDGNTTPSLQRVNGATDKAARLIWAAADESEVQFHPIAWPADVDPAQDVTVHVLVGKGSNTDTAAVIDVLAYEGLGDTEMGGNTAALATATITEYTRTLAAADIAGHPGFLNLGLKPGTHANDAIHLYGAWIEYASIKGQVLMDLPDDVDNRVSFMAIMRHTKLGGDIAT